MDHARIEFLIISRNLSVGAPNWRLLITCGYQCFMANCVCEEYHRRSSMILATKNLRNQQIYLLHYIRHTLDTVHI